MYRNTHVKIHVGHEGRLKTVPVLQMLNLRHQNALVVATYSPDRDFN